MNPDKINIFLSSLPEESCFKIARFINQNIIKIPDFRPDYYVESELVAKVYLN